MASKDKRPIVTVTEIGDEVEIQWTVSHQAPLTVESPAGVILCASVTLHSRKQYKPKRHGH